MQAEEAAGQDGGEDGVLRRTLTPAHGGHSEEVQVCVCKPVDTTGKMDRRFESERLVLCLSL